MSQSKDSKGLQKLSFDGGGWELIQSTFSQLMDLPIQERSARLAILRADNPELAREIESLLEFDHRQAIACTPDAKRAIQVAGTVVNGFRLLFPLAVTEKTEVWKAIDDQAPIDSPDREVAVKFLRSIAMDQVSLRRFEQEARFLSRFDHPNIARFLNCGVTDDSHPYLVTRFVSGDELVEHVQNQNCSIRKRLELMIQVCYAIEYAHRFLVVHRDIKPQNILVDHTQRPIVIDFGISKQVLPGGVSLDLTQTHERPMTPAYASPEQLRGEPVSTATDVYALGLILYQVTTGVHPYATRVHTSGTALFDRVITSMPNSPATLNLASPRNEIALVEGPRELERESAPPPDLASDKELARGLDDVIMKSLAKRPEDRFGSVAEMRNSIELLLSGQRVEFGEQRNRPWGIATLAALAALCLGAAIGWFLRSPADTVVSSSDPSTELATPSESPDLAILRGISNGRLDIAASRKSFEALAVGTQSELLDAAIDRGEFGHALHFARTMKANLANATPVGRIRLASSFSRMGYSTNALDCLGGWVMPKLALAEIQELVENQVDQREVRNLICRTLVECGQSSKARRLNGALKPESLADSFDSGIIEAEICLAYHWAEGARAELEKLRGKLTEPELPIESRRRFQLIDVELNWTTEQVEAKLAEVKEDSNAWFLQELQQILAWRYLESDQKSKAKVTLKSIRESLGGIGLPFHNISCRALVAAARNQILQDDARELLSGMEVAGENGTPSTMQLLAYLPEDTGSAKEQYEFYKRCKEYFDAIDEGVSQIEVLKTIWKPVLESGNKTAVNEVAVGLMKWGNKTFEEDSIELAELASIHCVIQKALGAEPSQILASKPYQKLKDNLAFSLKQETNNVAGAFLNAIDVSSSSFGKEIFESGVKPTSSSDNHSCKFRNAADWIHEYLMHRDNEFSDQMEMLAFFAENHHPRNVHEVQRMVERAQEIVQGRGNLDNESKLRWKRAKAVLEKLVSERNE